MLGSFITEPAAMTICALLLARQFYDLEPSTRLKYATLGFQPETAGDEPMPLPPWITAVHVGFMAWTVFTAHYRALFVAGFLIFLGFAKATPRYQSQIELKGPLLVGFFLAGLVIHGGLQAWWIAPVLSRLTEAPLFLAATVLTAFNDNAMITFLATLVPDLSESLKVAVVEGAVTGGGLTVIVNAPNPAADAVQSVF